MTCTLKPGDIIEWTYQDTIAVFHYELLYSTPMGTYVPIGVEYSNS